jgi:hypothetical protein
MKKAAVMILCAACLLCGCSRGSEEVSAIQSQYAAVGSARTEAEITCHLAGESRSFTVQSICADGSATSTVIAPEEIAGISATVSGDELLVTYDTAALAAGQMTVLSPANCVSYLMRAVAEGYVLEYGEETIDGMECLRVAFDTTAADEKKILCTVWFQPPQQIPCYAEFSRDGSVILTIRTLSFEMSGKED